MITLKSNKRLMDKNIIIPDKTFDFSGIQLNEPNAVYGGTYFTKIKHNTSPLYIQTPKCQTRQGFSTSSKKIYSDLIFNRDENMVFIQWLLDLENKCTELIYQNSSDWFQSPLELSEIESAFNSSVKLNKTSSYLIRVNVKINSMTKEPMLRVYNQSEIKMSINDVSKEMELLTILEISGIKFTTRSFQLELDLKQIMVLDKDIFDDCLIKPLTMNTTSSMKMSLGQNERIESNLEIVEEINHVDKQETEEDPETKEINEIKENKTNSPILMEGVHQISQNTEDNGIGSDSDDDINGDADDNTDDYSEDESLDDDVSVEKLTFGNITTLNDIEDINTQTNKEDDNIETEELHIETIPLDESILNSPTLYIDPKDLDQDVTTTKVEINEDNNTENEDLVSSIIKDMNIQASNLVELENKQHEEELEDVSMEQLEPVDDADIYLKPSNKQYFNLFNEAREKAKEIKKDITTEYLSNKNIKKSHMLEDLSDTSDEFSHNLIDAELEEL